MTASTLARACRAPRWLVLALPEPPSLNEMLDLAKQRARNGRPIVYSGRKADYNVRCDVMTREAGIFPPRTPWHEWRVTRAHFRLHNERDPIELLAGLKWPIDWLVERGFVRDDSPGELVAIAHPTQEINRANRGVDLAIMPDEDYALPCGADE